MKSYHRFKKFARSLEFLLATMLFSLFISRSFPYFSAIFNLFSNHHFIFLLGNAIVASLLLKFGHEKQSVAEVVDEYLIGEVIAPQIETVTEQNQTIPAEIEAVKVARRELEVKKCNRSRSNEFQLVKKEKIPLQRSETEPRRRLENPDKETASEVDNLSNEEFQRRVEVFIARQQKFLRDESLSIVSA